MERKTRKFVLNCKLLRKSQYLTVGTLSFQSRSAIQHCVGSSRRQWSDFRECSFELISVKVGIKLPVTSLTLQSAAPYVTPVPLFSCVTIALIKALN